MARKVAGGEEREPIYGPTYLPRKFKAAIVVPPQNDVDVFAHDLGFIAILEGGRLAGFNLTVGGGLGATHGDAATYPRLADVLGFLEPDQLLTVAEAVVTIQRDHGDRTERKHARLKYTIADRGVDWFKAELERRIGFGLAAARPFEFTGERRSLRVDGRRRRPLAPDASHRGGPRRGSRRPEAPKRTRTYRDDSSRRVPPDAQSEPDRRGRRVRPIVGASTPWWRVTASTSTAPRRRSRATRSPAWRCRPARSRWPRPSVICRPHPPPFMS